MRSTKLVLIFMLIFLLVACDTNEQKSLPSPGQQSTYDSFAGEANVAFLPVEEAFQFSSEVADDNTLVLRWNIAEGYHLYKDKFKFSPMNQSVSIQHLDFPVGEILNDPNFGKLEMYKHHVEIQVKLAPKVKDKPGVLNIRYQGCAEEGLCYPPVTTSINVL